MSGEARCPLGFTGTPPVGHPSIPGMKHGAAPSTDGHQSSFAATLANYKPSTLLIVDAVFLGLCVIAAIYRDDLKALLGRFSSSAGHPSASVKS